MFCLQDVGSTLQTSCFSFRWPELYFKVRKVLGTVEGMQSEGYLADTQNTSLYLVSCQSTGWLSRRSEPEVAQSMTKVPVEACVSCSWEMALQDRLSVGHCLFSTDVLQSADFLIGGFNKQCRPICPSLYQPRVLEQFVSCWTF